MSRKSLIARAPGAKVKWICAAYHFRTPTSISLYTPDGCVISSEAAYVIREAAEPSVALSDKEMEWLLDILHLSDGTYTFHAADDRVIRVTSGQESREIEITDCEVKRSLFSKCWTQFHRVASEFMMTVKPYHWKRVESRAMATALSQLDRVDDQDRRLLARALGNCPMLTHPPNPLSQDKKLVSLYKITLHDLLRFLYLDKSLCQRAARLSAYRR